VAASSACSTWPARRSRGCWLLFALAGLCPVLPVTLYASSADQCALLPPSATCLQALSSSYKASGSELSLQHLASEAQSRLLAADALVRKYGHERLFGSLLRLEGKEDVEAKFDSTIRELQSITNKVWCSDSGSAGG
jgi:hypothetical protein